MTLHQIQHRVDYLPNLLAFGKHCHNCGKWMQRRALRKDVVCNLCNGKIFARNCKQMQLCSRCVECDNIILDNFNYCECCGLETNRQLRITKARALSNLFPKNQAAPDSSVKSLAASTIQHDKSPDLFDDFQVDNEELTLLEESLVTDDVSSDIENNLTQLQELLLTDVSLEEEKKENILNGWQTTEEACGGGGEAVAMQGGGAPAPDADQAQFEADKRAVYKHPLFPLLALLLERCEQATAGAEAPAADAFGADLQAFVQHQRRDRRPFLVDDPEIDGLMIKSIQVLRIHLLELEKVQELCRDFCGRYIACLKTKMQSENLLRTDYSAGGVESNNNLSGTMDDHSSTSNSPQYQSPAAPLVASAFPPVYPAVTELPFAPHREPPPLVVQGSTPIGQIGAGLLSTDSFTGTNSNSCSSVSGSPPPAGAEEEGEEGGKRGVLPRHATQVMRAWLFQHLVHPYPTEEEKRSLAAQTRLTLLQVNNWFINARRRILQPMLDCQDKPGGKKSKNGSSISKRYWPDALTNPQFTAGLLSSSEDEEQEGDHSGDEQESQSEEPSEHAPYPPIQQPMH